MIDPLTGRKRRVRNPYIYKDKFGAPLHVGDTVELHADYNEDEDNVGNGRGRIVRLPTSGDWEGFPRVEFEGAKGKGHFVPDSALVLVPRSVPSWAERGDAIVFLINAAAGEEGASIEEIKKALLTLDVGEEEIEEVLPEEE